MREQKRKTHEMGIARRHLILGFGLVMVLGTAVYFKLWATDYNISASDTDLLRRQFDLAHREAVDESAEWRLRFDQERMRSTKCMKEFTEEKIELLERLESLKRELKPVKLKCKVQ